MAAVVGCAQIQTGHAAAEFGDLAGDLGSDARRATGDHDVPAVVAQQFSDRAHRSDPPARAVTRCLRASFSAWAAWTRPSLISAHASGISDAVNLPPRPVGSPPNA